MEFGKGRAACFRWAANTRTRQALSTWADNSRHASPWAAALHRNPRARGKRHPHAVRILMRAWHRGVPHDRYATAPHNASPRPKA